MTHLCTGWLAGEAAGGRLAPAVAWGAVLPDLASRGPGEALDALARLGARVPDAAWAPWTVLHTPALGVVLAVASGAVFVPEERRAVTGAIIGGVALHFAFDVVQDHHGVGYALGYPLTLAEVEFGWIGSEATVPWAGPLVALTAGVALARRRS